MDTLKSDWYRILADADKSNIKLRFPKLQQEVQQAQKVKKGLESKKCWRDINEILHYKSLPYIPKVIQTELISKCYNDLLARRFEIKKIQELVI